MDRHETLLNPKHSALLIIDVQERFVPVISDVDLLEKNILTLIRGCRLFDIPIFYTEQYPKGLGKTIPTIRSLLDDVSPVEKLRFSACVESLLETLITRDVKQLVIVGIETHVCILQTALDFTNQGYQVHVVQDAVGSRDVENKRNAIARMRQEGVIITCTESVLFEMAETAKSPVFREISNLVK